MRPILVIFAWTLCCSSFVPMDVRAAENMRPGTLIVVGGGGLPDAISNRFVELGGGKESRLVIIPTAADNPKPDDELAAMWKKRGIQEIAILHTTDREVADSATFVAPLKEATAVWIGGGQQSRLAAAYQGTAVERELIAFLERGGVIGGTSAGAAIQSQVMIASGNPIPEIKQGFDLVPDAIIDQHFLKRNRINRLLTAVSQHPERCGVGIDEATAIEVNGRECRVLGDSFVIVVQAQTDGKMPNIQTFKQGEKFSLAPMETVAH